MGKKQVITLKQRLETGTLGRNRTIRRRMLAAITRALCEVEILDDLSRGSVIPRTGKNV